MSIFFDTFTARLFFFVFPRYNRRVWVELELIFEWWIPALIVILIQPYLAFLVSVLSWFRNSCFNSCYTHGFCPSCSLVQLWEDNRLKCVLAAVLFSSCFWNLTLFVASWLINVADSMWNPGDGCPMTSVLSYLLGQTELFLWTI